MITNLSATEIAQSIRSGSLSPVEVVDAHIAHIEAVNPSINAVVITTFEKARQRAKEAEAALNRGELWGPLHGVPFTVKDGFDVGEGVPDVCGLVSRVNNRSTQESPLVQRIREAGAILLGKTNVPDNSSDMETINIVFGPTRNPWNLTHSAGGSSGGEGAIIAAGGSLWAWAQTLVAASVFPLLLPASLDSAPPATCCLLSTSGHPYAQVWTTL